MKILKKPEGIVFDTQNMEYIAIYPCAYLKKEIGNPVPLHHTHNKTDFEFLSQHFPKNHSIFIDFTNSYYYKLSDSSDVFTKKNDLLTSVSRPIKDE